MRLHLPSQFLCVVGLAATIAAASTRVLPRTVIGGYSDWGVCDDRIIESAKAGVNLVWWFAVDLKPNPTGLNLDCIANVSLVLRGLGLPTTHIVTIGGWDASHPTNYASAAAMYAEWKAWNLDVVARPGLEQGFDGVDFDLEGNDNVTSPWNTMSVKTLDLVGGFSQLAKRDGYLVTLVPCESYLDPTTSRFDSSLLWPYPEYHPEFKYHGHNNYAYILSRYGVASAGVPTFDAVTIQIYESYSHADFNTSYRSPPQSGSSYLAAWVPRLAAGWYVDFSSAPEFGWPSQTVSVPPTQLLIGLANGWAGGPLPKSVLIMPDELKKAWAMLTDANLRPLGIGFWAITDEGAVPSGQSEPLFLAASCNEFLHTRT